jgi:predicted phosphodiesterase
MTDQQIMNWIAVNPKAGRDKIAKHFGIGVRLAEQLKHATLAIANDKGFNLQTAEEQITELLAERGITIEQLQEIIKPKLESITRIDTADSHEFTIGIVSDTHLCDKACAINELHDLYSKFSQAGCEAVAHSGDLVSGHEVYRGQINDLLKFGFNDQLDYACQNYPKMNNGSKTYVISGNHDLSFKVSSGAHILSALADKRSDIIHCGDYDGTVEVNGIRIGLHHGDGGGAYAVSYKLQKAVEMQSAGRKPQIYVLGHYHTSLYMFCRNIHCFMPGCTQKPNDFSIRKNLPNTIGGWIVNVQVIKDQHNTIRKLGMEYVSYYD